MNNVSTSLEGINLISTTLIFIRDVITDSDSPGYNKKSLDELLLFLETFSEISYNDVTGLLRDARVHHILTRDVEYSIYSLNKCLAAHRDAWRYAVIAPRPDRRDLEDVLNPTMDEKYERKRWSDGGRERSPIWRERVNPGLYEALFGREDMETLILSCEKWICRLRQTLEVILLTTGPPTPYFRTSKQAKDLSIVEVLERQHRASSWSTPTTPSSEYNALSGVLRDPINTMTPSDGVTKTVYKDGSEEFDVMVEVRADSEMPTQQLCHLTWLLQALSPRATETGSGPYLLQTLNCMGFLDDPINNQGLILYRSPKSHPWASKPPSLHDLLTRGQNAKPSLENRFSSARALAGTMLAIHSSGWLHKNMRSKSVLMLPRSLNNSEPSPFVVGWGTDSPQERSTFDLEPNLYRHQDQFGRPSADYAYNHDIYSFGVVLLELGLWKTMSTMFARRIEKTPRFDVSQQRNLSHRIKNHILDLASSIELKREMGSRYAEVVVSCLVWQHHDPIAGIIEFRKQVVDVLTNSCVL